MRTDPAPEIDNFGLKRTFSIYDDTDSKRLMTMVANELNIDPKRYPPRQLLNWSPTRRTTSSTTRRPSRTPSARAGDVRAGVRELPATPRAAQALDFDDLIMTTVNLFQAFPNIREAYRRRFRHVLVDEYQDTNHAQYVLVRELCGPIADGGEG